MLYRCFLISIDEILQLFQSRFWRNAELEHQRNHITATIGSQYNNFDQIRAPPLPQPPKPNTMAMDTVDREYKDAIEHLDYIITKLDENEKTDRFPGSYATQSDASSYFR